MGHASLANSSIIFYRVWRRWIGFCTRAGDPDDPFLVVLFLDERELFVKAFLRQCYRTTAWTAAGCIAGVRSQPVVAGTIRQAASHLAASFRGNTMRDSPLHIKGGPNLGPFVVKSLFKAYENEDPQAYQQRAITPKLLRAIVTLSGALRKIWRLPSLQN